MFRTHGNIGNMLGDFKLENNMFRYSVFVPKLYNYCKSMGFETGKIMPSRAFCSDESQGYPIILIAKHFGTFPFNHGQVGGIVAVDRHAPHAEHGKDMVIIQASHVGYDSQLKQFGGYRRLCTEHHDISANCGKIDAVLRWYELEYHFAMNNLFLHKENDECFITIDNLLLNDAREEGLFLHMDKLLKKESNVFSLYKTHSTSKTFRASDNLASACLVTGERRTIAQDLKADYFYFKKDTGGHDKGSNQLENNLLPVMSWIVTAKAPLLEAAKANTQVEFDRAFRTIVKEEGYQGKRLIYISGLHIDISPIPGQVFPLTKFIPWAAFVQQADGTQTIIEQQALCKILREQSAENVDQVDLEDSISVMEHVQEVKVV